MRLVVLVVLTLGCTSDPQPATGPVTTSHVVRREIPLGIQHQLDLLFVVDNSPQMAAHRATLIANARNFIDVLDREPLGFPDLHLAVITTDVGSRGAGDNTASVHGDCSENGDAGVMKAAGAIGHNYFTDQRRGDGIRELDYDGSLDDALAATFEALPTGCSFPRPLEAVRRAVANPANAGFVRDDAYLAVIFLTASDDCSFTHETFLDGADAFSCVEQPNALVPVADFAAALKNLKADPAKVVVGGAFGPAEPFVSDPQTRTVEPSCTATDAQLRSRDAQPGVRMHAFFDQFPNRSQAISLCESDLTDALGLLDVLVKTTLGVACFDEPLVDRDPETPDLQAECASWLEFAGDQRVLTECTDGDARTCWRFTEDPSCPLDALRLDFDNYLPSIEPTLAVIECVAQ